MIVGGAQENTLATVEIQAAKKDMKVDLIFGTQTGPEGSLLSQQNSFNQSYNLIPLSSLVRNINPWKDIVALWQLYKLFKTNKYDVVHTHSSKAGVIGRIAAFMARTNVVVHTIHGLPFHPYQNLFINKLYVFLEKISAKCCHSIITVCDVMKEKAVAANIAPLGRFKTVYSGMDLDAFLKASQMFSRKDTRSSLGIGNEKFVVAKVARFFELKGHDFLIDAAVNVVKKHPNVVFLLVGDGVLKNSIKEKIESLGLTEHFVFTGLLKPYEIPKVLSCADMLVHASLREGLARVLAYAAACGKPAVSFDIDGACEIIEDGVTGFLVKAEDVKGLACSICDIVENKNNIIKLTLEKGPAKVDPIFRKEYMVAEINKIYTQILERN